MWTLFHSVCFDFSVWELWGPLAYGGRLVVVPYWVSREPEAFYELLKEEGVTVLNQTPSAFRQLMKVDEAVGAELALRVVIFGGEALEMSTLRGWFERHGDERPRLVNMYGITETTVHVTYRELRARDTEGGSVIGDGVGRSGSVRAGPADASGAGRSEWGDVRGRRRRGARLPRASGVNGAAIRATPVQRARGSAVVPDGRPGAAASGWRVGVSGPHG